MKKGVKKYSLESLFLTYRKLITYEIVSHVTNKVDNLRSFVLCLSRLFFLNIITQSHKI